MKRSLLQLVHKPKIVLPVSIGIALIIGVIFYGSVGRAPVVTLPNDASLRDASTTSAGSVDLSFLKAGRLATVTVHQGDSVHEGEVLATLAAADVQGALNQAKGALELAKAQYASLNVQYANVKTQQDVLVANAYRTLLSSGLAAVASNKDTNSIQTVDDKQIPQISGSYTCSTAGSYDIYPYGSGSASGYSFQLKGLEQDTGTVAYYTPQPLGSCGLFILFPVGYVFDPSIEWVVAVPNTRATSYTTNKNAYDLAVATRDQVLKQLEANLGKDGSAAANIAQATIDAAEGAYEMAQAAYSNSSIVAPANGTVSFIDAHLKVGENVAANKVVITITR